MELTKKDLKQIEQDTEDVMMSITACATEYAKLYEVTFYERLIDRIKAKKEAVEYVHDYSLNKNPER